MAAFPISPAHARSAERRRTRARPSRRRSRRWNGFALEDALAFMKLMRRRWCAPRRNGARPRRARCSRRRRPSCSRRSAMRRCCVWAKRRSRLRGVRVLDLTRVLAGPTVGRTLGLARRRSAGRARGAVADDRRVRSRHGRTASARRFSISTKPADAEQLRALARDAHVFVDSYRPGALGELGVTPAALVAFLARHHLLRRLLLWPSGSVGVAPRLGAAGAKRRPASPSTRAPFRPRARAAGATAVPALIPAAVCDYITGYLGAAGVAAALLRRFREGGSWLVQVSLCATAMWLQSLGKIAASDSPAGMVSRRRTRRLLAVVRNRRAVASNFWVPSFACQKPRRAGPCPPPEPGADKARLDSAP